MAECPGQSTEIEYAASAGLLDRGIELFNRRAFFECHEVLEELWRTERGERRLFLQGLIHLAVGFYHHPQGNDTGAERQLRKGLKKLAGHLPRFDGLDTGRVYHEGVEALDAIMRDTKLLHYPEIARAERGEGSH